MINDFFILLLLVIFCQFSNAHPNDIRMSINEKFVMNSQNMCDTFNGIISIVKSNKLNSSKILGPFQQHILKDGQVGSWGMYMLSRDVLGMPGKLVLYRTESKITDLILSPSAKHHFSSSLFLSEKCLRDEAISFVSSEEVNNKDYKFVNIFLLSQNGFKLKFRFFSQEIYRDNGVEFNRLTIRVE